MTWAVDLLSLSTGSAGCACETLNSDALLLSRATYEGFADAWPKRSGDEFSDRFNSMPKHVVSPP